MTTPPPRRAPRLALPLVPVFLLLAACGQGAAPGGPGDPSPSGTVRPAADLPAEGLVLRVEHVGGFVTPEMLASRLPVVSVYADGRVISQGPQIEIWPPPALPSLVVRRIDPADVADLAQMALDAGAGQGLDLGQPPIADATTTRVVVVTTAGPQTLDGYALAEAGDLGEPGGAGLPPSLTEEQQAAREDLRGLVRALTDLPATLGEAAAGPEEQYQPEAVAGVVTPWVDLGQEQPELAQAPVDWPGPPLPGEPLDAALGLTCVMATGEQADAVLAAAATASVATPWVQDGQRWSVALRPLLPDETGCADLTRHG